MAKTPLYFFFFFLLVGFSGLRSAISARVLMDDDVDAESQPQAAAVTPPLPTIPSPATTFPATQVPMNTIYFYPFVLFSYLLLLKTYCHFFKDSLPSGFYKLINIGFYYKRKNLLGKEIFYFYF